MADFLKIPKNLDRPMLERKFGYAAVAFYLERISQREAEGKIYYNPLKTIFIWATEDKRTNQGFYSSYRGYARGRKSKNFGAS